MAYIQSGSDAYVWVVKNLTTGDVDIYYDGETARNDMYATQAETHEKFALITKPIVDMYNAPLPEKEDCDEDYEDVDSCMRDSLGDNWW